MSLGEGRQAGHIYSSTRNGRRKTPEPPRSTRPSGETHTFQWQPSPSARHAARGDFISTGDYSCIANGKRGTALRISSASPQGSLRERGGREPPTGGGEGGRGGDTHRSLLPDGS